MDWDFYKELLSIDSTSGKERTVAEWLAERLPGMFPAANQPVLRVDEVGDGTLNLLLTWGTPRLVFCSHLDTVPPYIAPTFSDRCPVTPAMTTPDSRSDLTDIASGASVQTDGRSKPAMTLAVNSGPALSLTPYPASDVIPGLTGNLPKVIGGRGACDAKGQVFAMVTACQRLAEEGCTDFGLLLLAGEETGSWGAKAFAKTDFRAPYLVVGEPTDNCMVSASKGTKSFDLKFTGEPFHSGYPQYGVSAVDLFVEFVNKLKAKDFGMDPVLGETTWNIGLVHSDNPQNILSPELTCRIYFRTTFVSDEAVTAWMAAVPDLLSDGRSEPAMTMTDITTGADGQTDGRSEPAMTRAVMPKPESDVIPGLKSDVIPGLTGNLTVPPSGQISVTPRGGDTPARYWTVEGLPAKSVAFGSDAPHLKNFTHKAICGPGSITVAHRDDEHVLARDLEVAVEQYLTLYRAATQ